MPGPVLGIAWWEFTKATKARPPYRRGVTGRERHTLKVHLHGHKCKCAGGHVVAEEKATSKGVRGGIAEELGFN